METPSYYSIIPASVRYDNDLRANEKLLYGEITALTNKTGECWASNKYFSELYGVTPRAIQTWLGKLKDKGYIRIDLIYKKDSKEVEKRIICLGGEQKFMTPHEQMFMAPHEQMFVDNNTSINNTSINNIYSPLQDNVSIPYSEIIDYLNEVCKTSYRATTRKTKDVIKARWNEGFRLEDFKKVIDNKASEWLNSDMSKYLRPETLFGNKFEGYLNQKKVFKKRNNIEMDDDFRRELQESEDELNRLIGFNT